MEQRTFQAKKSAWRWTMTEEPTFYWCYIMGPWITFEKNKKKSKELSSVDSRDWESTKCLSREWLMAALHQQLGCCICSVLVLTSRHCLHWSVAPYSSEFLINKCICRIFIFPNVFARYLVYKKNISNIFVCFED